MMYILFIFSLLFADSNLNLTKDGGGTGEKTHGGLNGIDCCFEERASKTSLISPEGALDGTLFNPTNQGSK